MRKKDAENGAKNSNSCQVLFLIFLKQLALALTQVSHAIITIDLNQ